MFTAMEWRRGAAAAGAAAGGCGAPAPAAAAAEGDWWPRLGGKRSSESPIPEKCQGLLMLYFRVENTTSPQLISLRTGKITSVVGGA